MANLVIKPASGSTNKLIFQNQAGNVDAITVEDSGNIALSTIASGTITSGTAFPAGHIIQMNSTTDSTLVTRTGDQSTYAATGITCVLANDLQSSSKLFAQFSTQFGESAGSWWAALTVFAIYNNSANVGEARGLTANNAVTDATGQTYANENVSGSILFTPTGTEIIKRTISLYWRYSSSTSHTGYLNRADSGGATYNFGSTTLTLMEIAQ